MLATYLILNGITSETSGISDQLTAGAEEIEGWLKDLGVSSGKAAEANQDVSAGASDSFDSIVHGVVSGIESLSSIVFFVAMTTLSLFFLLKDGPRSAPGSSGTWACRPGRADGRRPLARSRFGATSSG